MICPSCRVDLNDIAPTCPRCGFHLGQLDSAFGEPPERPTAIADMAAVLSPQGTARITDRLKALSTATGCEFLVVTCKDTAPRKPSEFIFWLFNRWQVGGERHAGLMVLLALKERRIESEIGYALERIVTDAASAGILEHHAVPFLKASRYDEALYHSVDILCRLIENDESMKSVPKESTKRP